jgi:hypothetical protein
MGCSSMSNALLVYNLQNCQYYKPGSYRIDSYRLPGSVYLNLKYDGSLFGSVLRDNNPTYEEKYPPCTCVEHFGLSTNMLLSGLVDIPFPSAVSGEESDFCYTILFDNGSTASIHLSEMVSNNPPPPVNVAVTDSLTISLIKLQGYLRTRRAISQEFPGETRWCLLFCLQVSLLQTQGRLECSPSQSPRYPSGYVYWRHPVTWSYLAYHPLIPGLSRKFNVWSGGFVCECPKSLWQWTDERRTGHAWRESSFCVERDVHHHHGNCRSGLGIAFL